MINGTSAGFVAGSILAYSQGPRAALGGGVAFGLFSFAIELFLRREPKEYVVFLFPKNIYLDDYVLQR